MAPSWRTRSEAPKGRAARGSISPRKATCRACCGEDLQKRFKAANSRTGQPRGYALAVGALDDIAYPGELFRMFVDRHVVAIMGHKMPPLDPHDDDDEDE